MIKILFNLLFKNELFLLKYIFTKIEEGILRNKIESNTFCRKFIYMYYERKCKKFVTYINLHLFYY